MAVRGDQTPRADVPPALPLAGWRPTKDTLHLYCQIVGKIRLAATSPRAHWGNVPLCVAVRGLTTNRMRYGGLGFAIDFDLLDHRLVVRTDVGRTVSFGLREGLTVKEFHDMIMDRLAGVGVSVSISTEPVNVPMAAPYPKDTEHGSYDVESVERFWRVLSWIDRVFEEFSGWFSGRVSPVHLYWHDFELAVTRYSGRRVMHRPQGDPGARGTYTLEQIAFGFSPGGRWAHDASFYSRTHPESPDLTRQPLLPEQARWIRAEDGTHLAVLAWEDVRTSADPRRALLSFLQSAYEAGGVTAGWEMADLESAHCPVEARVRR